MEYHRYKDNPSWAFFPDSDKAPGPSRIPAVLCVFDNPVFLDQICRNLEQHRDILVDSSVSVEVALHLMRYVLFDAIVTDYTVGQSEANFFLMTVRRARNPVPFIYFTRARDTLNDGEARKYDEVYSVVWEGNSPFRGFDDLYLSVKQAIATTGNQTNPKTEHSCDGRM